MLIRNADEGGPPASQVPPARTNHTVVTYTDLATAYVLDTVKIHYLNDLHMWQIQGTPSGKRVTGGGRGSAWEQAGQSHSHKIGDIQTVSFSDSEYASTANSGDLDNSIGSGFCI